MAIQRYRYGIIWLLLFFLVGGCTTKPGYLQEATSVFENRWKVEKIEPADLSEDQKQVFDSLGTPTYVRFFRTMDTRKKVYEWVYDRPEEPVKIFLFMDGKRVEDIALDPDPSSLKSSTRRRLRLVGVVAGAVLVVPAIVFLVLR